MGATSPGVALRTAGFWLGCFALAVMPASAQNGSQVLVVVNRQSQASREIADYYMRKREIPASNRCVIDVSPAEAIERHDYETRIEAPIGAYLKAHRLSEQILYIVLTKGVPLKMWPVTGMNKPESDGSSVDSELTLLYRRMKGEQIVIAGPVTNPFFRQRDTPFRHPLFPMYLVTRLDAYTTAEARALVDKSLAARNVGQFVIDLRADESTPGNQWLRDAALLLPKDRVVMDATAKVLENVRNVIGYASWGSNDTDRKHRFLHNEWLPGAIATEFVSTDGRTLHQPPETWEIGPWSDKNAWFEGAPQSLAADYIHEGASGASGQALEPFLGGCPRPDFVLPAYYSGRNLAESFYMGIPALSWMTVVIGDPLMRLQ
jgi:uncharacterized protein (TIGR03790 family)